jgi:hypothetical protein
MLQDLLERQCRQVAIVEESSFIINSFGRGINVDPSRKDDVKSWIQEGFTEAMITPDKTLVFVTPKQAIQIATDQKNCVCCLSMCRFSSWCQHSGSTGKIPDPRTFCIQKTLQSIAHGGDMENNLMFAGHEAYRFGEDPFYANNFIPTTSQLVERIAVGY